jgi:hypothetical protein
MRVILPHSTAIIALRQTRFCHGACALLSTFPAYPNTIGPYWPNPDELPGQPNYAGKYPLPQINVSSVNADPTLCQSYHTVMNLAMMDGSVRQITASLTMTTRTNALNPDDGQILGSDW